MLSLPPTSPSLTGLSVSVIGHLHFLLNHDWLGPTSVGNYTRVDFSSHNARPGCWLGVLDERGDTVERTGRNCERMG